jgi:hypothetical protein
MKIQIRANAYQQEIIQQKNVNSTATIVWFTNEMIDADTYIDLLFTVDDNIFSSITHKPVIVNEVINTSNNLPNNYSRINVWNTFLEKDKLELVTNNETEIALSVHPRNRRRLLHVFKMLKYEDKSKKAIRRRTEKYNDMEIHIRKVAQLPKRE